MSGNPTPAPTSRNCKATCVICGRQFYGKPSHIAKRKVCGRACLAMYQRGQNNPNWRGGLVPVKCLECGAERQIIPARLATWKYCGEACKARHESKSRVGDKSPKWKGGARASSRRYREKCGMARKTRPPAGASRVCKACGRAGVKKGRTYHHGCRPRPTYLRVLFKCPECQSERLTYFNPSKAPERCRGCEHLRRRGAGNSNWRGGVTPQNQKIRASDEYKAWRTAVFERDDFTCQECGLRGGELNAHHIKSFSRHHELRFDVANGTTLCLGCHEKTDTYLWKARTNEGTT